MSKEQPVYAPYILSGYLINGENVNEEFTLYSYELADTVRIIFDSDLQSLLLSKDYTLPEPNQYLEFSISYNLNVKIRKGRDIKSTIKAYSYWVDDDTFVDFEEYEESIENRNQYNFYLKLIIAVLLVFLGNLIHKRWFSIIDYLERFSEKINAKVDPITTKPTAYQEYKAQLEEEKYRGSFKATNFNPNKVYRRSYEIQSAEFNLGLFLFSFVLLAGAFYYLNRNLSAKEIAILLILYSLQAFLSFKKGERIIIDEKGIKWDKDKYLAWTDIQFSYLYLDAEKTSLLLKLHSKNEPVLIPVDNLTLTPKQIGSIVAKFTDIKDPNL
ncbi:hypothetical protein [Roseivirga misakiensis]|uniref:Uncharacterized protein n=1 Tax=Roseivirga misakiensis TaxID=1563681 RepID=A0A1E5T6E0_9BACT|nr:hypothetical protein [Roseivirga misakiensis]OEK06952.1 hypothetical protein BFP71_04660 [Roseivirga misakiensis]